jgi:diguanylate cyclase (GGDEF)-like protein
MTSDNRSAGSPSWETVLEENIETARARLLTRAEFGAALQEIVLHPRSPIAAVQVEISRPEPHDDLVIGIPGREGEPASLPVDRFDPINGATCRIRTWIKETTQSRDYAVDFASVHSLLGEWARAFWKADARDVTGLLRWQDPKVLDMVNTAVRHWSTRESFVSVFFGDLDNFKAANDRFGQEKGNDVILSFGALMERILPASGVVVRQGGDEFLAFVPTDGATTTLRLARQISQGVNAYDFGTAGVKIGVAVGVSMATKFDKALSAEGLATRAEKAVKPGGDAPKLRGLVRFGSVPDGGVSLAPFTNESRDLAGAWTKVSLLRPTRLNHPWLDLLSAEAEDALQGDISRFDDVRAALYTLLEWAKPDWVLGATRLGTPQEAGSDRSSAFSRFDAALATAHGVFRGMSGLPAEIVKGLSLNIKYAADLSSCETVLEPKGRILFSSGEGVALEHTLDLGAFFTVPPEIGADAPGRLPILVHIGYEQQTAIPNLLFDRVILVDARPSASGGLPDFWASAVANLISAIVENPNVPAVYVMGDLQHGVETVAKLDALNNGAVEADQIAEKTGLALRTIRAALPRLERRIVKVGSADALYEDLIRCLRDPYSFQRPELADEPSRPILDRPLAMDNRHLTREDGCRVGTINEAFPIVLEIARTSTDDPIRDQAGRDVRELIDFKVHLTSPTRGQIPDFYLDDAPSFAAYYEKQFLAPDGLFGAWFQHQGQLDLVVKHVAEVIAEGKQFATRRATLVVPHVTEGKNSPTPLGLVSIRIVPRFNGDYVALTYSYTWRTVEALVGFPYSSYGSVRFSQHLTDRIRAHLPEEARQFVRMKDVSYVAHSLHFFVDAYGQKIARKIVNDATS